MAEKMKALVLENFGQQPQIAEIDIPQPGEGEVLIRVEATPINPSDAMFMKGSYQNDRKVPCVPGFEGSGVVVKSGGGAIADSLVNKKVAFFAGGQHGSYAQYTIANALWAVPLPEEISLVQAACSFVNPITVLAMLEVVKKAGVQAVVHSAAASQLGRMMVRYFQQNGVKVINIVRRQEQVEILQKEGAEFILNSSEEDYLTKLKALATEHKATIFLDAIAGAQTGEVLNNMPNNSIAYVYGALSLQAATISPIQLIFRGHEIRGFWLSKWLVTESPVLVQSTMAKLLPLLLTDLKTEVGKEVGIEEGQAAIKHYLKNMSSGKVLFKPNSTE